MPTSPQTAAAPGDRLATAGGAVFLLGLLATVAALVTFLTGGSAPLWLAVSTLLAPAGLALALTGLLWSMRHQRREVIDAMDSGSS